MCMKHNPGCSCCIGAWVYYSKEASSPSKRGKRIVLTGTNEDGVTLSDKFPYRDRWVYDQPQDLDFDFLVNGHETLYLWDSVGALHVLDAKTAKPKEVISDALPNGHALVRFHGYWDLHGNLFTPYHAGPHGYTYITTSDGVSYQPHGFTHYIHHIFPDGTRAFPYVQLDPSASLYRRVVKNEPPWVTGRPFISGGWEVYPSAVTGGLNHFSDAYVFQRETDAGSFEVKVGRTSWNSDGTITIKDVVKSETIPRSLTTGMAVSVNGKIKYLYQYQPDDNGSELPVIEHNIDEMPLGGILYDLPEYWDQARDFFRSYGYFPETWLNLEQNSGDTATIFNSRAKWHSSRIPLSGHITEFGTWYYGSGMPGFPFTSNPPSVRPSLQGNIFPGAQHRNSNTPNSVDKSLSEYFPDQVRPDYYQLIHRDGKRLIDWAPKTGSYAFSKMEPFDGLGSPNSTIGITIPTYGQR